METKNKEGRATDYIFRHERYYTHYSERGIYRLWEKLIPWIGMDETVFEIGCGTGQFGHFADDCGIVYTGMDFSPKAIEVSNKLKEDMGLEADFILGDARDSFPYKDTYDVFVCFDTLEHIKDDRAVVGNIPSGKKFIFIVPTDPSFYHVRYFRSKKEIRERYGDLLDIETIIRDRFFFPKRFLIKSVKK